MLRKATIEVGISKALCKIIQLDINLLEHMDCLKIVRFGEKEVSGIVRVKMKRGRHPSEFSKNKKLMDFQVLSRDGDEYICLAKKNFLAIFKRLTSDPEMLAKHLDKDLIINPPMTMTAEMSRLSIVGTQKAIAKYLSMLEKLSVPYKVKSIKDHDEFEGTNTARLTQRQREIISTAYELGYYERTRKISSEKLAEIFGVNRGTLIEHLRKSEQKILKSVFG